MTNEMTNEEEIAIAIIRNEYLCVDRDCDIERSCDKCDLAMPNKEPILKAFKMAIKALETIPKYKDAYNKGWVDGVKASYEHLKMCEEEQGGDLIRRDETINILLNEMECVQRASDEECNRDCAKCDLLRDTDKILQAYRIAIRALEHPEENVVAIMPCADAISRQKVLDVINLNWYYRKNCIEAIENLPSVNPQESKIGYCKDCKWWKDSDGIYRRGFRAESSCPFNTKEIYEGDAFCYRFEPQESEVSK